MSSATALQPLRDITMTKGEAKKRKLKRKRIQEPSISRARKRLRTTGTPTSLPPPKKGKRRRKEQPQTSKSGQDTKFDEHYPRAEKVWPARCRNFKCWRDEDIFIEMMTKRGWKDLGKPCDEKKFKIHMPQMVKGKRPAPRRCLWWVDVEDSMALKHLHKKAAKIKGGNHKISAFPGTEVATYKTNLTRMFNCETWYPTAYVLPRDRSVLEKVVKTKQFWVSKPKDDYGGHGVVVYSARSKIFRELIAEKPKKPFIVQEYIANPLLIGGYKFHMRMYLICTSVQKPVTAFVHRNGNILFSTEPYCNKTSTMGKKFNPYIHLTNATVNWDAKNAKRLLKDKNVLGKGCEWNVPQFEQYLRDNYQGEYTVEKMWADLKAIAGKVVQKIAGFSTVKKYCADLLPGRHFQIFGMDIMLDDQFNMHMLETNTTPGLVYAPKVLKQGGKEIKHPSVDLDAEISKSLIRDLMALFGLDDYPDGNADHMFRVC